MSIVQLVADIHTSVMNFDFTHIVTFLNRLPDAEMRTLPMSSTAAKRSIIVELWFTWNSTRQIEARPYSPPHMLGRWLNRLEHPTKRGVNVDLHYRLPEDRIYLSQRPSVWTRGMQTVVAGMAAGRRKEELAKILAQLSKT